MLYGMRSFSWRCSLLFTLVAVALLGQAMGSTSPVCMYTIYWSYPSGAAPGHTKYVGPDGIAWDSFNTCIDLSTAVGTPWEAKATDCATVYKLGVRVLRRTDTQEIIGTSHCCSSIDVVVASSSKTCTAAPTTSTISSMLMSTAFNVTNATQFLNEPNVTAVSKETTTSTLGTTTTSTLRIIPMKTTATTTAALAHAILEGSWTLNVTNAIQFLNEPNVTSVLRIAIAQILQVHVSCIQNVTVIPIFVRRLLPNDYHLDVSVIQTHGRILIGARPDVELTMPSGVKVHFRVVIPLAGKTRVSVTVLARHFNAVTMQEASLVVTRIVNSGVLGMPYTLQITHWALVLQSQVAQAPSPGESKNSSGNLVIVLISLAGASGTGAIMVWAAICWLRKRRPLRNMIAKSQTGLTFIGDIADWTASELLSPPDGISISLKASVDKLCINLFDTAGAEVCVTFAVAEREDDVLHTGPGWFYAAAVGKELLAHGVRCCADLRRLGVSTDARVASRQATYHWTLKVEEIALLLRAPLGFIPRALDVLSPYTVALLEEAEMLNDFEEKEIVTSQPADVTDAISAGQIKILILVETVALYTCGTCLCEIFSALENNVEIMRLRFDGIPDSCERWPQIDVVRGGIRRHIGRSSHTWSDIKLSVLQKLDVLYPPPRSMLVLQMNHQQQENFLADFATNAHEKLILKQNLSRQREACSLTPAQIDSLKTISLRVAVEDVKLRNVQTYGTVGGPVSPQAPQKRKRNKEKATERCKGIAAEVQSYARENTPFKKGMASDYACTSPIVIGLAAMQKPQAINARSSENYESAKSTSLRVGQARKHETKCKAVLRGPGRSSPVRADPPLLNAGASRRRPKLAESEPPITTKVDGCSSTKSNAHPVLGTDPSCIGHASTKAHQAARISIQNLNIGNPNDVAAEISACTLRARKLNRKKRNIGVGAATSGTRRGNRNDSAGKDKSSKCFDTEANNGAKGSAAVSQSSGSNAVNFSTRAESNGESSMHSRSTTKDATASNKQDKHIRSRGKPRNKEEMRDSRK